MLQKLSGVQMHQLQKATYASGITPKRMVFDEDKKKQCNVNAGLFMTDNATFPNDVSNVANIDLSIVQIYSLSSKANKHG